MFGGFSPCAWHKDEAGVWMVRLNVDALPPPTFYSCSPPRHEKTFSVRQVLTCEP
jgi:hypothetical protein